PNGANVSVTVDKTQGYDLPAVNLYPEQPQPIDIQPPPPNGVFVNRPFKVDRGAYAVNKPFPAHPADAAPLGSMRDLPIGGVDTTGGQYFPKSRRLHVFTSITYTVHFGGANQGNFGDGRLGNPWSAPVNGNYAALINWSS